MIRRRGQEPQNDDDSSSEEEDAFSALSRKSAKRQKPSSDNQPKDRDLSANKQEPAKAKPLLPVSLTSSMKRHHKPNEVRKAKMDALLQELEAEKNKAPKEHRFVPEKKGSFVEPSEEHLTTNIFVGNLAPSLTEEDITDLFLQYGDLYSVKIMWPRTPAEKSRKRNTEKTQKKPWKRRQLMMRWGKNVKKNVRFGSGRMMVPPTRKASPQDIPLAVPTRESDDMDDATARSTGLPDVIHFWGSTDTRDISKADPYQAPMHSSEAIHVQAPSDPARFHFISTVASYVARDGSSLERALIESEAGNPLFNFLTLSNAGQHQTQEYLFYRWRVYSFCQGDRYSEWRTEPFVMFHPKGRFWIPPRLDKGFAHGKKPSRKTSRQDNRPSNPEKQDYMTGRQFERAMGQLRKGNRRGFKGDGADRLTPDELEQFDLLVRKKLSISRESICKAMAYCFEKSGSAKEIVALLKEALLDESPLTTVDMRIARLYLISDILFNSQQPGVRNAFMYRDALEKMAPEIFAALGTHGGSNVGRMSMNKLRKAVSSVLGAWTEWSVYNPTFLDELEARFEGREVKEPPAAEKEVAEEPEEKENEDTQETPEIIINQPRGGWTEVDEASDEDGEALGSVQDDGDRDAVSSNQPTKANNGDIRNDTANRVTSGTDAMCEPTPATHGSFEADGRKGKSDATSRSFGKKPQPFDDVGQKNIDGAPVGDSAVLVPTGTTEIDGTNLDGKHIDGAPIEETLDGDPVDDTEVAGPTPQLADIGTDSRIRPGAGKEASPQEEGTDGNLDGEALDGEALDGEALDGEDLGSGDLDGEVLSGKPLDDEYIDGEALCEDEDIDGEEIDEEDM